MCKSIGQTQQEQVALASRNAVNQRPKQHGGSEVVTFGMATDANKCFSLKSKLTNIKPICSSNFETNFNREKMSQTSLMTKFSTG